VLPVRYELNFYIAFRMNSGFKSVGSSTVQFHGSLGSRRACACSEAGVRNQYGARAEEYITEEQRSVARFFCGQKD
jgi:hypothetical protein